MEDVIEGKIIHYVLESGRGKGEHRPAIIVKVWGDDLPKGMVNIQVFTDGKNDDPTTTTQLVHVGKQKTETQLEVIQNIVWRTSVHHSEGKEPGTWHFIEETAA